MALAKTLAPLKTLDPKHLISVVALMCTAKYQGLPENTYTDVDRLIEALQSHEEKIISHGSMPIAIGLVEYNRLYDLPETDHSA